MFGTRSALVWPRGLLSATQEPTGASGRARANMPIWVNTRNGSYRLFSIRQDLLAPTASDDDRRRRLTPPHWQPRKKSALQICNSFYLVFILRLTIKTILFKKKVHSFYGESEYRSHSFWKESYWRCGQCFLQFMINSSSYILLRKMLLCAG